MSVAKQLIAFRQAKGLSASEVARRLKVSESTYRDWENGRQIKGEPYLEIARVFEVSLSEVFLGPGGSREAALSQIRVIETILQELKLKL